MHGLIDGDILVYRIGYSTEDVPERLAKFRLRDYFESICEKLILTNHTTYITSTDKSNFRYQIDSSYKANRTQPKPVHYDFLRHCLSDDSMFNTDIIYGREADDAIGIHAGRFSSLADYCVISLDKDLNQIPGWHYNFVKEKKYYVSNITACRFFYKQLLSGDSADNIDGITGIGEKISNDLIDGIDSERDMYRIVHHIYNNTDEPFENLITRGQLLKIQRNEHESLWLPPVLSEEEINEGASHLIKVDWKKSFERYSKRRLGKVALATNPSDSTSSIQLNSDSTSQTG